MTAFYAVYFTTDHYTILRPKSQYVRERKNKKEGENTRNLPNRREIARKKDTVARGHRIRGVMRMVGDYFANASRITCIEEASVPVIGRC